jgi:hypothetical protein
MSGHRQSVATDPYRHFAAANCRSAKGLFNHLVGNREYPWRHLDAERSRGLQIDDKLKFGRCLHRKVGRFLTLEDTIDVTRGCPFRQALRPKQMSALKATTYVPRKAEIRRP